LPPAGWSLLELVMRRYPAKAKMLLCNNTAFRAARLIKQPRCGDAGLPLRSARPILATMSEADELARRFLALWSDYLTALLSDPKAAEPLRRWLGFAAAAMPGLSAGEANPAGAARPPSDAPAAAGPSGERDALVAELARRVDELAERVAALESRGRPVRGAKGRGRTARRG